MSQNNIRFTLVERERKKDIKKHDGVWKKVDKIKEHLVHLESILLHGGERKEQQVKIRFLALFSELKRLVRYHKENVLDKLSGYEHSQGVVDVLFRCYLLYENALYRKQKADPMVVDILQGFDEARKRSFQELFEDVKDVYDRYYKINKHFPPRNNHH